MQLKNQINEKMKSLKIMMEYFLTHLIAFTSEFKKDESIFVFFFALFFRLIVLTYFKRNMHI